MEVFGYIILIVLACLGIGAIILFALPYVASVIKTVSYKIKRETEVSKIDIDAKAEAKKIRDEKLRAKQKELADKKLALKLKKVQSKIDSVDKDIEIKESLEQKEEKKEEIIKQPQTPEKIEEATKPTDEKPEVKEEASIQ